MICKACKTGLIVIHDDLGDFVCFKCPVCGRCYDYKGDEEEESE